MALLNNKNGVDLEISNNGLAPVKNTDAQEMAAYDTWVALAKEKFPGYEFRQTVNGDHCDVVARNQKMEVILFELKVKEKYTRVYDTATLRCEKADEIYQLVEQYRWMGSNVKMAYYVLLYPACEKYSIHRINTVVNSECDVEKVKEDGGTWRGRNESLEMNYHAKCDGVVEWGTFSNGDYQALLKKYQKMALSNMEKIRAVYGTVEK